MLGLGSSTLGLALIVLGLVFILVAPVARLVARLGQTTRTTFTPPVINIEIPRNDNALIVIRPGGQVAYLNENARQWFGLLEDEEPNLERLGRATRPIEDFMNLCAVSGRARFTLQQTLVEGYSYEAPYQEEKAMLVTLQRPKLTGLEGGGKEFSNQAVRILTDISQAMTASLDLEIAITTVLESVDRLIPFDFAEITLLESDLLTPYRYAPDEDGVRRLETGNRPYQAGEGYSSYLIKVERAIMIDDALTFDEATPAIDRVQYPFISFLGVPLIIGGTPIGTLELASQTQAAFSNSDKEILSLLSGHAAVAVQNALTHTREQGRIAEMSGLQQLSQLGNQHYSDEELYAKLTEAISPMLDVSILGFLVYNEPQRILAGRTPFVGLPDQFVGIYQADIPIGSEAEKVWESQDIIHTDNAETNEELKTLKLNGLCQAAAMRDTVLAPLIASGHKLGYLQVANKIDNTAFDEDDIRLLQIIAGQAAPIIENAKLDEEARRRSQRAEALRRIASLAGSNATTEEVLKFAMLELSRYLQAEQAVLLLLDENLGEMHLHRDSQVGLSEAAIRGMGRVALQDINYREMATFTSLPVIIPNLGSADVPSPYQTLREFFPQAKSAMIAPLEIQERGIGEIILTHSQSNFFEYYGSQSLNSAASQIAYALERSSLYAQTDESLKERLEQLTAITRVSRELNTTLNLTHLLQRVYDEAIKTTQADGGSIVLFEVDDGHSNPDKIELNLGSIVTGGLSPLEKEVLEISEALIISDFESSPYPPSAEGIRSALVAPIAYQGNVAGLIHLHGRTPSKFNLSSLEIVQALAVQAAIAFGNAQRYQEQVERGNSLNRRVETLDKLLETTQSIQIEAPLNESLETIAYGIQESSPFDVVLIHTLDQEYQILRLAGAAGIPLDTLNDVADVMHSWETVRQMSQEAFELGKGYFVPYGSLAEIPPLAPEYAVMNYTLPDNGHNAWQPGDRLIMPLLDGDKEPIGVISVDAPRNGLRPDHISLETIEIFANQASLVVESYGRLSKLRQELSHIESKSNGNGLASAIDQENLSVLLHKDLEQTIAIQQLHQRARNIRAGLDIAETVNRQPDRQSALSSLASELVRQLDLDAALIAEPSGGGPRLLEQIGELPEGANPQVLLGQRNPLRQTIQSGEAIFVSNLDDSPEWQDAALLKNLNAKSFISLPISSNGHVEAAVLAVKEEPLHDFSVEDQQIYDLIVKQVSITLQNINLLTETRRRLREVNLLLDFSRQLGSLDTAEILNTLAGSIRRVMPAAHAVALALWNPTIKALVTQSSSGYSDNALIAEITYRPGEGLPGQAFADGEARLVGEVDFVSQYNLSPDNLMRYRQATGGRVPVSSLLAPIQTSEVILGVITVDNFNTPEAFTPDDLALVSSLAQQTALTLENARLFNETRRFNEELEQRVEDRTQELAEEHRISQTLLQISTELSASLDLDHVLSRTLAMLNETTGAEQSSIMLQQPGDEFYLYRAGVGITKSPPSGGRMSSIKVGEGLIGQVIEERQARLIPDLMELDSWMQTHRTGMHRSAIVAPLIVGAEALGALMLYHREQNYFKEAQIRAVQATANQFAVSINNGELFRLIRDQAEDLGSMLRDQQIEASRSTAMLEGVADGVLVTDEAGVVTLFNEAAATILELPSEQVVGKSLETFAGLFGGVAENWTRTIQHWSANPEAQEKAEMYSEQITLEDGRVVSVHLAPVFTSREFLGTVSIFRDITYEVEVDRLKSEFVATVSHELRTPMTPIKGYVEFLMMGGAGALTDQQKEFLDIIKSNIDRLSILVNDLLDVSRIEAGKVALTFQPVDMIEIANQVVQITSQKALDEGKPTEFVVQPGERVPSAYGDQERILQILTNLVDNAYKYSPEGKTVTVKINGNGESIQVDVVDQGIGIFPEDQGRVFDRFFRGENHLVMATAGTGLGLPIVKELVDMHNGSIWVASSGVPGEGSVFSFTLPIYLPDEPDTIRIERETQKE